MAENDRIDQIIKDKVLKKIESIDVPIGFKSEIWQQVQPSKPRNNSRKLIPYFAMAASIVIMVLLIANHLSENPAKTPENHPTQQTTTTSHKNLAESYLIKQHYSIKSYEGENAFIITPKLLNEQPTLSIELQTANAYYVDNDLEFGSQSLMNQLIIIENFSISGHWREKYVNKSITKVGVVLLNNQVLGGFTVPNEGESSSEGIWPLDGPATDAILKVEKGNVTNQKPITEKLFSQYLEERKTTNRMDEQISSYKIQSIKILHNKTFHGFDFNVQFDVLPAYKDKFVLAGGMMYLKNGWVTDSLRGKICEVKAGTYLLMGVGSGP